MDYRGFIIKRRTYGGDTFYVALKPRPGGGNFGDIVASDPCPTGINRRVDEYIEVNGLPSHHASA